jgi:uncharacterized protein YndB with AHSA1/START domain/DNA-binding transcriptional ArsR family regulator
VDEVFKALADPGRRRLLDRLNAQGGQTLRQLCAGQDVTRQAVAKHLAVLEAAGLVVTVRRGREKLHHLNAAPIHDIADRWIHQYDRARAAALADLKRALEENAMSQSPSELTESGQTRFVYVTYIRTTPEQVWRALTDTTFIRRYFEGGGPLSDWTVGSPVKWRMSDEGEYLDWGQRVVVSEPYRRLVYTWHNYQPEMAEMFGWTEERLAELRRERISKVSFDIEPASAAVKLTVVHDDFEPDSEMLRGVSEGWPGILSNLKSLLETGEIVAPPTRPAAAGAA